MEKKTVALNRAVGHFYEILEIYEAGLSLLGNEVKSVRAGNINIKEGFVRQDGSELFLFNVHIAPYRYSSDGPTRQERYNPLRKRKLLLHRNEIKRLIGLLTQKGLNLIPREIYFKKGIVKVEFVVAKKKKLWDKREAIKEKEIKRQMRRLKVKIKGYGGEKGSTG